MSDEQRVWTQEDAQVGKIVPVGEPVETEDGTISMLYRGAPVIDAEGRIIGHLLMHEWQGRRMDVAILERFSAMRREGDSAVSVSTPEE